MYILYLLLLLPTIYQGVLGYSGHIILRHGFLKALKSSLEISAYFLLAI